jgi:hypothetical protein
LLEKPKISTPFSFLIALSIERLNDGWGGKDEDVCRMINTPFRFTMYANEDDNEEEES